MSLFLLDSDILSLMQAGHPVVTARVKASNQEDIALSVIAVEEQIRGWYTLVRKAKTPPKIAAAYDRLARSISLLSGLKIVPFTETMIALFETLKCLKLGIRSNDLRIAASALELNATVVTRNRRDFEPIPGLTIVDWSKQ